MSIAKIGLSITISILGLAITGITSQTHGYLEYRYYCDTQGTKSISISLGQTNNESIKCLSYINKLNNSINFYLQQIKQAQSNIKEQPEFLSYRQGYIDDISPKLMQTRIMHIQIKRAMTKFENDLFEKTMIYIKYRYTPVRNELIEALGRRQKSLERASNEGDEETMIRISKKHRTDKRRLEMIELILKANNFEELMPFYSIFDDIPNRETQDPAITIE